MYNQQCIGPASQELSLEEGCHDDFADDVACEGDAEADVSFVF